MDNISCFEIYYKSPDEHILKQLLRGTHMTMIREEMIDSNDTSLEYAK